MKRHMWYGVFGMWYDEVVWEIIEEFSVMC